MSEEPQQFWIGEEALGTIYGVGMSKGAVVGLTRLQSSPYTVTYRTVSLGSILRDIDGKYDRWGVRRAP